MRLSDLMKNRDRVSDRPLQKPDEEKSPESSVIPLPSPGGAPPPAVAPEPERATQAPPEATPAKTKKPPPDSGQPQQQLDKVESSASESTANASLYDSLPSAIYQAAAQLKIPIPQIKELNLRNAKASLLKVFARAVDSTDEKKGLWEATRKIADDLSVLIALDSNFAQMTRLCNHTCPEERLMNHSINTAVIAMDIAKNLIDKTEYSLQEIGAAALLHDLGVAALGLDLVSDEKDPVFRKHVAKSVEILEQMKATEAIRTIVAQHHERIDGQGYPAGISGNEFLVSSQILSLAGGFERIIYESSQDKQSQDALPQNPMNIILRDFNKTISPDVLKAFISLRGFYPNDTMVELTNRSIYRVIRQNKDFPLRPVVQLVIDSAGNHPEEISIIDLRVTTTISIMRAISHNK